MEINLIIYNNIYEKCNEYNYGARRVEIQVDNGHAVALIPKDRISVEMLPKLIQEQEEKKKLQRVRDPQRA